MATKHVHKYHHIDIGYGTKLWACALPTCNHHMPKHLENSVIGKFSICWNCGQNFILDTENMKKDRPICISCLHPLPEPILDLTSKFAHPDDIPVKPSEEDLQRKLQEIMKD